MAEAEAPGAAAARNLETDRLFAYHERTKHSYATVHGGGWALDWANQPNPFRRYAGAPRWPLPASGPLPAGSVGESLAALGEPGGPARPARDTPQPGGAQPGEPRAEEGLPLLGSLLHHAMGVSAWKQVLGTELRYSLRVNPSSGNLHPTETWLALQGLPDAPDGLYHYDVRGHALERRRIGPAAQGIAALCGLPRRGRGALLVLSSIFWREAWKYRDRAYRYCLLDAGHAASSLALAARALGLPARVHGHFPDEALARLMALDTEEEWPLLVIDLRETAAAAPALAGDAAGDATAGAAAGEAERAGAGGETLLGAPAGEPNRLSEEVLRRPLIEGMHASTLAEGGRCPAPLPEPDPFDGLPHGPPAELPPGSPAAEGLAVAVRRRRSAIDYLPEGRCDSLAFAGLLRDAARLPRCDFLGNLEGGAPVRLVELYAYVHTVEGLRAGCWRVLHRRHALSLVRPGDVRSAAAGLSLGQELAGHAIAAFSLVADLERGARAFGNRAYRYAHIEAGMIGQALYLGATARGLGATGIGAFYDDDVHRWLGLAGRARQVVYHHSVGVAAPDPRLIDSDRPAEERDDG